MAANNTPPPTRDSKRIALDDKLKPYTSVTFTKAQAEEVCQILDAHLEEFTVWLKGLPPTVPGNDHSFFRKCWAMFRNEELYFFQKWLVPYS